MSAESYDKKLAGEQTRRALTSTLQCINGAIPLIGELADEFYRGPEQGTWVKLQKLIEYLERINLSTGVVSNNKECIEGLDAYLDITLDMKDKVAELLKAMEKSDMVLMGDLLCYEIIPVLEAIRDAAGNILKCGVDGNASH